MIWGIVFRIGIMRIVLNELICNSRLLDLSDSMTNAQANLTMK